MRRVTATSELSEVTRCKPLLILSSPANLINIRKLLSAHEIKT
jgi:hypothetical protein